MPKIAKELSPLALKRLCKMPGQHPVGGVAGLLFQVSDTLTTSWILRVMVAGKRRSIGLGAYPGVTLAAARVRAQEARNKIDDGVDPIAERRALRSALAAQREKVMTFDQAATKYISDHAAAWSNAKHVDQWRNTISTYASPVIGNLAVSDIETPHIMKVLDPLWREKTETATRLRGRIEKILGWATVRGYRTGDNPARWKGHLESLLPDPAKVAVRKHHAALPWPDMAGFMTELRKQDRVSARALEFAILTACRSGEVRGARWSEVDLERGVWIIPAERMKAKREHRVALSNAAVVVLKVQQAAKKGDIVFPGVRGQALSDMALSAVLKRMGRTETVHGFRSSFRDWVAEATNYPGEMAELALAHAIGNKVEAAYRRGDMFAKRIKMMDSWAKHCDSSATSATVVSIQSNTAA